MKTNPPIDLAPPPDVFKLFSDKTRIPRAKDGSLFFQYFKLLLLLFDKY